VLKITPALSQALIDLEQWVKTQMGGETAELDPTTSATKVLDIIARDAKQINGKFLKVQVPGWENAPGLHQYDGGELPW
jgi:hypothetical protein